MKLYSTPRAPKSAWLRRSLTDWKAASCVTAPSVSVRRSGLATPLLKPRLRITLAVRRNSAWASRGSVVDAAAAGAAAVCARAAGAAPPKVTTRTSSRRRPR